MRLRANPLILIAFAIVPLLAQRIACPDMLERGRQADLLIVEGDPARDITALERPWAAMQAGRWVHRVEPAPPR